MLLIRWDKGKKTENGIFLGKKACQARRIRLKASLLRV